MLTAASTLTPLASKFLYFSAMRPISVVHTGVKSAGWEKRMAHLPSILRSMGDWPPVVGAVID